MKHQPQRLLFSTSLTLCLLSGIEAKLAYGQENTGNQRRSDENTPQQESSGRPDRQVALRKLPENILQDQKTIVLFPRELAKGRHWWPTIGIVGSPQRWWPRTRIRHHHSAQRTASTDS